MLEKSVSTIIIVFMKSIPEQINSKICLKIRIERIKRGWSQEYLGEKAGVSTKSIGAIERVQSTPTALTLAKIANAFDITVSELTDISKVDL